MNSEWTAWLARWTDAGLIDAPTADRIRAFEQTQGSHRRMRWPILIALACGGLMVGGGILLFVAAHWEALSPAERFAVILTIVGGLHVGGAFAGDRFPAMGAVLHAVGTVALGAGIALSGQIFNLDEHWPGGVMLWALGAGLAAWLLRDGPQTALFAILAPLWLAAEWTEAHGHYTHMSGAIEAGGGVALALAYLTAVDVHHPTPVRRALRWTGGVALAPLAVALALSASDKWDDIFRPSTTVVAIGISVAVALPLAVAYAFRRERAWHQAVALLWIAVLCGLAQIDSDVVLYGWWAIGAIGLVAWGVADGRVERINLGAAAFAATVFVFYFSEVMDKLGRSASLIGLGLLFLGGGWALERLRRRLVAEARGQE